LIIKKGNKIMLNGIIFLVGFVVVWAVFGYFFGYRPEKKRFNNGICLCCGGKLSCFDMDSQGGRLYDCDGCEYWTSVSYPRIDKNYN
jgi:hypothetical protein